MKQGILVPFDGSANASEALQLAIEMAKAFNEKIVLLNTPCPVTIVPYSC